MHLVFLLNRVSNSLSRHKGTTFLAYVQKKVQYLIENAVVTAYTALSVVYYLALTSELAARLNSPYSR